MHLFEWMLLGFGLGCLGIYAYETVEARRFQAEQAAAFEQQARAQTAPGVVKPAASSACSTCRACSCRRRSSKATTPAR